MAVKKSILMAVLGAVVMLLSGCNRQLLEPVVNYNQSDCLSNYKFFYINPTGVKTGSSGSIFGSQYGVYGGSSSRSTDPCAEISGVLIKKGFVRLAELDHEVLDKTLVVTYAETGRRELDAGAYALEVTIQMTSAKTHQVVVQGTAEGLGETEADDIRIAIARCMGAILGEDLLPKVEVNYMD